MGLGLIIFTTSDKLNATYTFSGTVSAMGAASPRAQIFVTSTFGSVVIAIVAWAGVSLGAVMLIML